MSYQLHKVKKINITFDLDFWPAGLNINRDHLDMFLNYQLHKVKGDRHTDRQTDRPTNMCNAICPPSSKVGINMVQTSIYINNKAIKKTPYDLIRFLNGVSILAEVSFWYFNYLVSVTSHGPQVLEIHVAKFYGPFRLIRWFVDWLNW